MKLTKITAENLKGRSFSFGLGKVTKVTGANRSGKTAVADAINLALYGVTTGVGKTSVKNLISDTASHMLVQAQLDDGSLLSRTWKKGSAGRVSATTSDPEVVKFDPLSYAEGTPAARKRLLQSSFAEAGELDLFSSSSTGCLDYGELLQKVVEAKEKVKDLKATLKRDEATLAGNLQTSLEAEGEDYAELSDEVGALSETIRTDSEIRERETEKLTGLKWALDNQQPETRKEIEAALEKAQERFQTLCGQQARAEKVDKLKADLVASQASLAVAEANLKELPESGVEDVDFQSITKLIKFLEETEFPEESSECPCCKQGVVSASYINQRVTNLRGEMQEAIDAKTTASQRAKMLTEIEEAKDRWAKTKVELAEALEQGGDVDGGDLGAIKNEASELSSTTLPDLLDKLAKAKSYDTLCERYGEPTPEKVQELTQRVEAWEEKETADRETLAGLRKRQDRAASESAAEAVVNSVKERIREGAKELKAAKETVEKLEASENEALRNLVRPLFTRAKGIIEEVLGADVMMDGLDLLLMAEDGTPVTFKTMSGSERMLVALAIEAAFSKSEVAVMDEAGILDKETADKLEDWARFQNMFKNVVLISPGEGQVKVEVVS